MSYEPAKAQTFSLEPPQGKYSPFGDRTEILRKHREWLDSKGQNGERADFSGARLDGVDLTDANLEDAWLNKTILKSADLLLANFQRASLIQANLQGANLLGARFQEADLQGATLESTSGLQVEQLAGTNLFDAKLPADVDVFDALADAARAAKIAGHLVLVLLALTAAAAFRVITTADWQILSNAPVLPFRIFRAFPLGAVYLLAPALLLGLYVWLHLFLQSLWENVSRLPAIFPDGRTLDKGLPWVAALVARTHLKWLRNQNRSLVALENTLCQILLYWIVPVTIVLFWGRYLTAQDFRGSMLHILEVVAASIAAVYFSRAMKRTLGCASPAVFWNDSTQDRKRPDLARVLPLVVGATILFFSIGVISGAPRDDGTTPLHSNYRIQSWAADLLWLGGYSPVAQVRGASISVKPTNWTGRDEDLGAVLGARLGKARLRYIQANGAFLAKSDLWQADLQSADLSEADLREIKARQARLRYASLDRAKLDRASLEGADLRQANLTRADLKGADLTYASLTGAALVDADFEGASLYSTDMRGALLQRARLQQADLREANLAGDDLTAADLRSAYLSSAKMAGSKLENAELDAAFLTEADLRGADLRNAKFTGTALNGANLQGADLRGALGLSPTQVCSAAEIGQIQLDDALRQGVEAECHSAMH